MWVIVGVTLSSIVMCLGGGGVGGKQTNSEGGRAEPVSRDEHTRKACHALGVIFS